MIAWIKSEPAFFFGLVQAAVTAVFNAVAYFWAGIDAQAIAIINIAVVSVLSVILSLVTRSRVTPATE